MNLEEDRNFIAGLGSLLGHYREWIPHFARLSKQKLANPMQWLELDRYWAQTYYVSSKTFSVLHLEVDGHFVAGRAFWLGGSSERGPHSARL